MDSTIIDTADVVARSIAARPGSAIMARSPVDKDEPAFPGHDSMVTVRLSEPPSLSVNTDLPPNLLPSRRSLFGPEYTPTPTSAIPPENKEDEPNEDETSPNTAVQGKNLLEELEESEEDDDSPEETSRRESVDDSEDEVNWDKLQKSEDEQAQVDDNVGSLPTMVLKMVLCGSRLT
jgi:hypothetical protein